MTSRTSSGVFILRRTYFIMYYNNIFATFTYSDLRRLNLVINAHEVN